MDPLYNTIITPIINELTAVKNNFSFLSTLEPSQNLQPTCKLRQLGRVIGGYEDNPIQKTLFGKGTNDLSSSMLDFAASSYAYASDAYSRESFDGVISHYSKEIDSAKKIFKNTMEAIKLFETLPISPELKQRVIIEGKSAFWNFAAARMGLHQWVNNLNVHFSDEPQEMDYRIKMINQLLLQQNEVIKEIFKISLCQAPLTLKSLKEEINSTQPKALVQNLGTILPDAELEKKKLSFKEAANEFVNIVSNFIGSLEQYEREFKVQSNKPVFEEKFQIYAYFSLMEKAKLVKDVLNPLKNILDPQSGKVDINHALNTVDVLHNLFITKEGPGVEFISALLASVVDLKMGSRMMFEDLAEAKHKNLFPKSKNVLYQRLASQQVTGRFLLPLDQMLKDAKNIPGIESHVSKIKDLCHFFTTGTELAQKTMS